MAILKRGIARLQKIRTQSNLGHQNLEPHRAYMRISCLEMEKARRNKERESALRRVEQIEARFQEIQAEETKLLQALKEAGQETSPGSDERQRPTIASLTRPELAQDSSGFKFQY